MAKRIVRHPGLEYRRPVRGTHVMPEMDLREPQQFEGLDLREQPPLGLDLRDHPPADPEEDALLALASNAQKLPTKPGGGTILREGELALRPIDRDEEDDTEIDLGPMERQTVSPEQRAFRVMADLPDHLKVSGAVERRNPTERPDNFRQMAEDAQPVRIRGQEMSAEDATAKTLANAGFDANGDPLNKAKGVLARAKPGSSRELSPTPDRPTFDRKPLDASGAGASSLSKQVADLVTGKGPADVALANAREDEDRATLAADLGEAGAMVGHAGLKGGHDRERFNADRAGASKSLDRLKEDRTAASSANAARIALEDKLRAQGREDAADRLKAERERAEMKHREASLAETTRHNKAMEQVQRSRGENGSVRVTPKEQERKDTTNILGSEVRRMTSLGMGPDGKPKSDIPGVGPWDGSSIKAGAAKLIPGLESPEDSLMDQSIRNSVSKVVQMASGRSATDNERRFLMTSYGMERDSLVGGSEEKFAIGLQKFREDVEALESGRAPPNNPAAWSSLGVKLPGGMNGQPAGSVKPQGGGFTPEKKARLEELRRKRDAGMLK